MLVDLIVGAVLGLFTGLLELLPVWTFERPDVYEALLAGVHRVNYFLPLTDLVLLIGIALGVGVFMGVWHLVVFVYERIPFKAS